MKHQNANEEISLQQVGEIVVKYKWFLTCMSLAFILVCIPVAKYILPQWEASVVLQVGQIDNVVVPVRKLMYRLSDQAFKQDVFKSLAESGGNYAEDFEKYDKSLDAEYFPDADTVKISFRTYSQANAENILKATVVRARGILDEKVTAIIAHDKAELLRIQASASKMLELQKKSNQWGTAVKSNYEQDAKELMTLLIEGEIVDLQAREKFLVQKLESKSTFESSIRGNLQISNSPVTLGKWSLFILAGLVGFLFGFFLVLFRINAPSAGNTRLGIA